MLLLLLLCVSSYIVLGKVLLLLGACMWAIGQVSIGAKRVAKFLNNPYIYN